jgi:hypothetical protein
VASTVEGASAGLALRRVTVFAAASSMEVGERLGFPACDVPLGGRVVVGQGRAVSRLTHPSNARRARSVQVGTSSCPTSTSSRDWSKDPQVSLIPRPRHLISKEASISQDLLLGLGVRVGHKAEVESRPLRCPDRSLHAADSRLALSQDPRLGVIGLFKARREKRGRRGACGTTNWGDEWGDEEIGYPLAIQSHAWGSLLNRKPCKINALGGIRTPNLLIRREIEVATTGATSAAGANSQSS